MKIGVLFFLMFFSAYVFSQDFTDLAVGNRAANFKLKTIQGVDVELSKEINNGPLVILVLRGWPEYQCSLCSRQVGQFLSEAEKITKHKASVLMVYPGSAQNLVAYGEEFSATFDFPSNYYFVLDPDYKMIDQYGLRWDAPRETAYPSTFVIDEAGKIVFSKISKTHGGRANVDEILEVLAKL